MVTNIHGMSPEKMLSIYNAFFENQKKSVRVVPDRHICEFASVLPGELLIMFIPHTFKCSCQGTVQTLRNASKSRG